MRKFYSRVLGCMVLVLCGYLGHTQVNVTATTGTPTTYPTVKAAFDAINAGGFTGAITVSITANTTESATALLNSSGTGSASYTSVLIRPATGVTATVAGNVNGPVLNIIGSNVTIDGSNNGTTTRDLTFSNSDTTQQKLAVIALMPTGTAPVNNVVIKNTVVIRGFAGILASESQFGPTGVFTNITIQNNRIEASTWGIFGIASGSGTFNVTGNDLSATGANSVTNMGIYLQGVNGSSISNNIVGNFEPTQDHMGNDVGIWVASGSSNTTIEKNQVRNIGHLGGQGYGAHGIRVSSGTPNANITISNNMIANIFGDGWNYTSANFGFDNPIGILADGAQTGINIYFNSINLYGNVLNTSNAISVGIYLGGTTTGNVKNNIVVNNHGLSGSTGHGAVGIMLGSSAAQLLTADNNNYFVNPTGGGAKNIGQIGTTGYTTLAAWQAATGKEANSKNVLPVFTSPTDLHLVNASNSALENLGSPVAGITTDIDGETRNATNPDMGADEFVGTGTDVTAPAITYTPLTFACGTGNRTLSGVTISDAAGTSTTGALVPRIYYKKSTGSTWYSGAGTLTAGTGTSGTWSFTITAADMGTLAPGDVIQYYVIAQDLASTPNVGSNPAGVVASNVNTVTTHPASPNSYVIGASLTGNYNVGSGQTFPTLTAAVAAYNSGCLAGAVTFTLMDANYGAETFPIIINSNPLASAANTLTIKPGTGVNATITGTSTGPMIYLRGADYVTIDGSNTAGGTSRNLSLITTATTGIPMIWITSVNSTDGANNNTIKNMTITGNANTTTVAGILAGGNISVGSPAESPNSNNTISNNAISKVLIGIYTNGNAQAASYDQNWTITGNTLGSTTAANKLGVYGIVLANAQAFNISDNTISGIATTATSTSTASGITISGGINGGTIARNRISDVKQMNPTGYGANGINLDASTTASNVLVVNNFIWNITGEGWNDIEVFDNGYGMIVTDGGGYNIYYNTVNMNTNQTSPAGLPAAFNVTSDVTSAGAINLRNNIFVNTQTAGTQRYAIISNAPSSVFGTIDHNNYYTTGTNLGFANDANQSNLAALQSSLGGNASSTNVLPVFVSANDLHLNTASNSGLSNTGTPIAGITTDIDNDTRSTTTPDMGADEFTVNATCTNPVITTQPAAQTVCAGAAANFSVTATGTGLTYQWKKDGANIAGATSNTYSIPAAAASNAGSYTVEVFSGTCSVISNAAVLTVTALPVITTQPASVTTCLGQNATFTVAATGTGLTYQWRFNGTPIAGATSASFTVSNIAANFAGAYSVVVSSGTCSVTSNNANLTVSGPCTSLPNIDADITKVVLMPNVVNQTTTLRVHSGRTMKMEWSVVDMNGKVVMTFENQVAAGQNDFQLRLASLAAGTYQLMGQSSKGRTEVIRLIKL